MGSEMCIRDRVYTEPPNTEVLEESGIAEGQELEDGGVESGEVEEIGA